MPTCPVFTRAKIKSRLGILVKFAVTIYIMALNDLQYLICHKTTTNQTGINGNDVLLYNCSDTPVFTGAFHLEEIKSAYPKRRLKVYASFQKEKKILRS